MSKENQKSIFSFYKRKRDYLETENVANFSNSFETPETISTSTPTPATTNDHSINAPEEQSEIERMIQPIFRGIEFVERDPGIRPQISNYPPSQRDEVRRAYLSLGAMRPMLHKFKASGPKGHQRRFQPKWFDLYPWLEYSVATERAYCFNCFLFSDAQNRRSGFDVFTRQGFDNWKKAKDAFDSHMGSNPCSQHHNAVKASHDLLNQSRHLENVINLHSQQEKEQNRLRLKVSIAAVRWLTFQGCAFRGHNESIDSRNRGNFIEILQLLADFNPDIDKNILENAPVNCKYISPDIQKEILSIYATLVRKYIREEIGDSKFSIIVDETCDVSKREQAAVILRFVDKHGILRERFFDLIHVKNVKSVTLYKELCFVLSNHSLSISDIRGQGYDGGSNMKGEFNGLQALFLRDCPEAYYVHCYAHRLQLALVAASKEVVSVSQFFFKLNFITNTVDASARRHGELREAQVDEFARLLAIDELSTGRGENQIRSLKRAGDTRWGSHLGSISSLMDIFNAVSSVLEKKKSQDILNAMELVASTNHLLQNMRDNGWANFLNWLRSTTHWISHSKKEILWSGN